LASSPVPGIYFWYKPAWNMSGLSPKMPSLSVSTGNLN
jgi:hypothetical protein